MKARQGDGSRQRDRSGGNSLEEVAWGLGCECGFDRAGVGAQGGHSAGLCVRQSGFGNCFNFDEQLGAADVGTDIFNIAIVSEILVDEVVGYGVDHVVCESRCIDARVRNRVTT